MSLSDFRDLSTYFVDEAKEMCSKLLLGLDLGVDLIQIKDDLTNIEYDFSFIKHPGNDLR